jgi:DNA polymerase-4
MAVLYIRCGTVDRAVYAALAELVGQFTPLVETAPPDVILADVSAALRYFDRLPEQLALMIGTRAAALHGVRLTIGAAGNRTVAAMAAYAAAPGRIRAVDADPGAVAAFLAPRPVAALDGVDAVAAEALARRGLLTVGQVAATPLPVLQGILGPAGGTTVLERAHGIDPRPVSPDAPPKSLTADRLFSAYGTEPAAVRRSLPALADSLARRLHGAGRSAATLDLTIGLSGGSSLGRTRTLPAPTAHASVLAGAAHAMYDALAPDLAGIRAVTLSVSRHVPPALAEGPVGTGKR